MAAQCGHLAVVKALLEAGADPEKEVQNGAYTAALYMAAAKGHTTVVKALLKAWAKDKATSDGFTALHVAQR